MKFPHVVKYNGVRYPAGAEVPVGSSSPEVKEEKQRVEVSRSHVQTMKKADLVSLAIANGIDDAEEKTAADLKAQLIKKLGL